MNNVMYQTRMLNREIKHSNEYNQYMRTLQNLKENSDLYERTKEFQKRNFSLQCFADYNTLGEVEKLREEYKDILVLPAVKEYLGAEQRVLNMLRRVEDSMLEGIELQTDILD